MASNRNDHNMDDAPPRDTDIPGLNLIAATSKRGANFPTNLTQALNARNFGQGSPMKDNTPDPSTPRSDEDPEHNASLREANRRLTQQLKDMTSMKRQAEKQVEKAKKSLEEEQSKNTVETEKLKRDLVRAQQHIISSENKVDSEVVKSYIELNRDLTTELNDLRANAEKDRRTINNHKADLEKMSAERNKNLAEIDSTKGNLRASQERVKEMNKKLKNNDDHIQRANQRHDGFLTEKATLEKQHEELKKKYDALKAEGEARQIELQQSLEQVTRERSTWESSSNRYDLLYHTAQKELSEFSARYDSKENHNTRLKSMVKLAKAFIRTVHNDLGKLQSDDSNNVKDIILIFASGIARRILNFDEEAEDGLDIKMDGSSDKDSDDETDDDTYQGSPRSDCGDNLVRDLYSEMEKQEKLETERAWRDREANLRHELDRTLQENKDVIRGLEKEVQIAWKQREDDKSQFDRKLKEIKNGNGTSNEKPWADREKELNSSFDKERDELKKRCAKTFAEKQELMLRLDLERNKPKMENHPSKEKSAKEWAEKEMKLKLGHDQEVKKLKNYANQAWRKRKAKLDGDHNQAFSKLQKKHEEELSEFKNAQEKWNTDWTTREAALQNDFQQEFNRLQSSSDQALSEQSKKFQKDWDTEWEKKDAALQSSYDQKVNELLEQAQKKWDTAWRTREAALQSSSDQALSKQQEDSKKAWAKNEMNLQDGFKQERIKLKREIEEARMVSDMNLQEKLQFSKLKEEAEEVRKVKEMNEETNLQEKQELSKLKKEYEAWRVKEINLLKGFEQELSKVKKDAKEVWRVKEMNLQEGFKQKLNKRKEDAEKAQAKREAELQLSFDQKLIKHKTEDSTSKEKATKTWTKRAKMVTFTMALLCFFLVLILIKVFSSWVGLQEEINTWKAANEVAGLAILRLRERFVRVVVGSPPAIAGKAGFIVGSWLGVAPSVIG